MTRPSPTPPLPPRPPALPPGRRRPPAPLVAARTPRLPRTAAAAAAPPRRRRLPEAPHPHPPPPPASACWRRRGALARREGGGGARSACRARDTPTAPRGAWPWGGGRSARTRARHSQKGGEGTSRACVSAALPWGCRGPRPPPGAPIAARRSQGERRVPPLGPRGACAHRSELLVWVQAPRARRAEAGAEREGAGRDLRLSLRRPPGHGAVPKSQVRGLSSRAALRGTSARSRVHQPLGPVCRGAPSPPLDFPTAPCPSPRAQAAVPLAATRGNVRVQGNVSDSPAPNSLHRATPHPLHFPAKKTHLCRYCITPPPHFYPRQGQRVRSFLSSLHAKGNNPQEKKKKMKKNGGEVKDLSLSETLEVTVN